MISLVETNRLCALAAPRGHAKTTLFDLAYASWKIAYNQIKFGILCSRTHNQAVLFLEDLKTELATNDRLIWLFGQQKSKKWKEDDIVTANGIRIMAKGQGMQFRGLKHRESRPDFLLLDDIEDEESVATDDRRRKLEHWFNSSVLPSMAPDGQAIIVGSILHYDSLLARLTGPSEYREFAKGRWSAMDDEGNALWPDRFPIEDLLKLRDQYAERGQLYTFSAEYLNDPIPPGDREFQPEFYRYFQEMPKVERITATFDPAISQKSHADYTGCTVRGLDKDGNWYILEAWRKRLTPPMLIDEIFRIWWTYRCEIGVEMVSFQQALHYAIADRQSDLNEHFEVKPLEAYGQKEMRIRGLLPLYRANKIHHKGTPMGDQWKTAYPELEEEQEQFPRGKNDDILDSLSMHLQLDGAIRPQQGSTSHIRHVMTKHY